MYPLSKATFPDSGPRFLLPRASVSLWRGAPLPHISRFLVAPGLAQRGSQRLPSKPDFSPALSPGGPGCFPLSLRRATQEELQRRPSPVAETPPLQRRPSVRAVISTVGAGRGRSQAEPIPEAEESQRPGQAGIAGSADPVSPDLGPRGPDLASLQAEREVVSARGLGSGGGPAGGSES